MPEIIIDMAPDNYRGYLTIGDARGNFNKKIDSLSEAKISAGEMKVANPVGLADFLNYLEAAGFQLKAFFSPSGNKQRTENKKGNTIIKPSSNAPEKSKANPLKKFFDNLFKQIKSDLDIEEPMDEKTAVQKTAEELKIREYNAHQEALGVLKIIVDAKTNETIRVEQGGGWIWSKKTTKPVDKEKLGSFLNALTDALLKELNTDDAINFEYLVDALIVLQDQRAIPPLIAAMENRSILIRYIAAKALDELKWVPADKRQQTLYLVAKREFNKLDKTDASLVEIILPLLEDKYVLGVNYEVAKIIGEVGDVKMVEPLIKAFRLPSQTAMVREEIITALEKIKNRGAAMPYDTPALIRELMKSVKDLKGDYEMFEFKVSLFTLCAQLTEDRLRTLFESFDDVNKNLLYILYRTRPKTIQCYGTDADFRKAVENHDIELETSQIFNNKLVVEGLSKFMYLPPSDVRQFVMLIKEVGNIKAGFWGFPPYVAEDSQDFIEEIRLFELTRHSTIIKLLVQEGDIKVPTEAVAIFRWSRAPDIKINLPLLWDKDDIPQLKNLLNSNYEYYRKAAAKALKKLEKGKTAVR